MNVSLTRVSALPKNAGYYLSLIGVLAFCGCSLLSPTDLQGRRISRHPNLVLWNELGSQKELQHSAAGPNACNVANTFVTGVHGHAIAVSKPNTFGATFPISVLPRREGCLEFWAKVTGAPEKIPWGNSIFLAGFSNGSGQTFPLLAFNSNDGTGNGGLCAGVWGIGSVGTGAYGMWTFTTALKGSSVSDWHHYAVVWSVDSVYQPTSPVRRIVVYVDGKMNSGYWGVSNDPPLPGQFPEKGVLGLGYFQNTNSCIIAIDQVKIWSYAKGDFGDRYD